MTTDARVGHLIAADRYLKRDEVGYVTQLCVAEEHRRSLVAAQLLQAQFDRSAYGCRLYCCWCAQDLAWANAFWEAMGFVAIAFRTGSLTRGRRREPRVHIFWQKRIRAGDETTPWWYPSQTGGGALRADRLVFPILPGVSWRDVGPILLDDAAPAAPKPPRPKKPKAVVRRPPAAMMHPNGLWFEEEGVEVVEETALADVRPKRSKPAIDPRLTAMSRELRDQWSERQGEIVPEPTKAKHDVKRIAKASKAALKFAA